MRTCQAPGCCNRPVSAAHTHCIAHTSDTHQSQATEQHQQPSLALMYPKYYKELPQGWTVVDTYAVNILFPVDDPSGCLLHARKKLLIPGVRSGGKSMRKDVTEARDALNRWLELNPE